ncbi:pseudouridine synthase pus4, partial [Teratosphaeriaceae sp. CCFEE 6253]
KRRSWKSRQASQVKMGHGGTLDPLATGVLILGVGAGTKALGSFLACTKSYEAVVLFGVGTDSYDTEGKVVARGEYAHVTREKVEQALGTFRGEIMQRPPIFSALRVQGKRLYEYAREGKEVPVEIQERPVTVEEVEVVEWMDGGGHGYKWPEREAGVEEKQVVEKVLHLGGKAGGEADVGEEGSSTMKRKREEEPEDETGNGAATDAHLPSSPKRAKASPDPVSAPSTPPPLPPDATPCPAPAVRLRMTVTSGFYVRSLAHDLGAAVGSLGIMASLVRTRQGQFELGRNALEYGDLAKGEEVWGGVVEGMLREWQQEKGGVEEVKGAEGEGEAEEGVGKGAEGAEGDEGAEGADGAEEPVEAKKHVRNAKPAARAGIRKERDG